MERFNWSVSDDFDLWQASPASPSYSLHPALLSYLQLQL